MPQCPECNSEVMEVKDPKWSENKIVHLCPVNEKMIKVLDKYNIPFRCKSCRSLNFPYRVVLDRIVVFPDPLPEKVGSLFIPMFAQESHRSDYGIVLAVGGGYVNKKRHWVPMPVKVGERVIYDKTVPWGLPVEDSDGKLYDIKYMGEQDIQGIVEGE